MSESKPAGRRAAVVRRRRVDVLVALAILLPTVVALALGAIGDEQSPVAGPQPPGTAELTSATVVCPGGTRATSSTRVGRAPGVAAIVSSRRSDDAWQVAPRRSKVGQEIGRAHV